MQFRGCAKNRSGRAEMRPNLCLRGGSVELRTQHGEPEVPVLSRSEGDAETQGQSEGDVAEGKEETDASQCAGRNGRAEVHKADDCACCHEEG